MTNNSTDKTEDRNKSKMKKVHAGENTLVIKLGLELFTTADSGFPVCNFNMGTL